MSYDEDALTPEEKSGYLTSVMTDVIADLKSIDAEPDEVADVLSGCLISYCVGRGETRHVFIERMRLAYDKHREELFRLYNDADHDSDHDSVEATEA